MPVESGKHSWETEKDKPENIRGNFSFFLFLYFLKKNYFIFLAFNFFFLAFILFYFFKKMAATS